MGNKVKYNLKNVHAARSRMDNLKQLAQSEPVQES